MPVPSTEEGSERHYFYVDYDSFESHNKIRVEADPTHIGTQTEAGEPKVRVVVGVGHVKLN